MSDSIKSADRRLKLILLLQSKKHLTASKIADYFGVSIRTVFRDLRALQELNVPILHDPHEGYHMMDGYRVPPLMFTERELASIIMGLSFMKAQVDQDMREDAKQVQLKIKNALTPELRNFASEVEEKTIVSPYLSNIPTKASEGKWYTVMNGIALSTKIGFEYTSASGTRIRTLRPHFLVYYFDHWNVLGFDDETGEKRNFLLSKMSKVILKAERFEAEKHLNLDNFIYRFAETDIEEFEVRVMHEHTHRFLSSIPGKVISVVEGRVEGFSEVSFEFDNKDYLFHWLLGFADVISITNNSFKSEFKEYVRSKLEII